ncbi:MAG: TrwM protein [Sphingobacteriaceae bacterium]|nr:MAG: TrwM protein [Sphingobacteriaceae bacterium]
MDEPFLLFKGATRVPTVLGVPMIPLMFMCITVAAIAMLFGLIWYLIGIPIWFIMSQITKHDDQAFHVWWLWLDTKWLNYRPFWQASTYSKAKYHKRQ